MAKKNPDASPIRAATLNAALNDYSAITRVSVSARVPHRRTTNWPIYAAATGSALAMATGASASLITSGIITGSFQNATVNPLGPNTNLGLQLGGPSVKLHAVAGSTANGPTAVLALLPGTNVNLIFSGASSARNFALGSPIQGSADPGAKIVKALFSGNLYGNFVSGQVGFAGLSFHTALGNTDYGWIKLKFTGKGGAPFSLQALAFGLDTNPGQTPGTLAAGQVNSDSATPEPGTMTLASLAAGAACVIALKRRRKAAVAAGQ